MSKKNKEGKKPPESKPLLSSQRELIAIKIQRFNQANEVLSQRKTEIQNTINIITLELGVPEGELGEWGLSQDGTAIVKIPADQKKRFPGLKTVKKREKKKKPGKNQQLGKEE